MSLPSIVTPSLRVSLLFICLLPTLGWAITGPEVAIALNQRLAATPARCAGNQPDYACSGVLARPLAEQHPVKFWEHDADSTARGSELFVYLRRDGNTGPLPQRTGYVLMNRFDALAQGKPYEVSARPAPDDVQVRNWDASAPGQLAVEALYFDPAQAGGLLRGQRAQFEWFKATGAWLPLLRMGDDGFGFDQREQLYNGYSVAARINQRYVTVSPTCPDGSARFHCQGVWVRTTGVGNFRSWNPSPGSIAMNGVSVSFFSADTSVQRTLHAQGFILHESAYPTTQPITLRCGYPTDAGTGGSDPCTFRGQCAALGITSVAAWRARYGNSGPGCAFASDAAAFSVLVDLRNRVSGINYVYWNELMMAVWPQNVPAQLPLEAFIYTTANSRANAQKFQQEYVQDTQGRYLPLLMFHATPSVTQLVEYFPEDQKFE